MSAMSQFTRQTLGEYLLRGMDPVNLGVTEISLHHGAPGDGTQNKAAYTGYADRPLSSVSAADGWLPIAPDGRTKNKNSITFPPNGNDPSGPSPNVTITHFTLWSVQTAAPNTRRFLLSGQFDAPKTLEPSDVLSLPLEALEIEFA